MTAEMNKYTVAALYDELNNDYNLDGMLALCAPDMVIHDPMMGTVQGAEAFRQMLLGFKTGFPEHRAVIHRMLIDGDYVTVLHTHIARHTGPFMGLPPTGCDVQIDGVEVLRVVDGKVVEFWRHDDDAGLMRQLGFMPAVVA